MTNLIKNLAAAKDTVMSRGRGGFAKAVGSVGVARGRVAELVRSCTAGGSAA